MPVLKELHLGGNKISFTGFHKMRSAGIPSHCFHSYYPGHEMRVQDIAQMQGLRVGDYLAMQILGGQHDPLCDWVEERYNMKYGQASLKVTVNNVVKKIVKQPGSARDKEDKLVLEERTGDGHKFAMEKRSQHFLLRGLPGATEMKFVQDVYEDKSYLKTHSEYKDSVPLHVILDVKMGKVVQPDQLPGQSYEDLAYIYPKVEVDIHDGPAIRNMDQMIEKLHSVELIAVHECLKNGQEVPVGVPDFYGMTDSRRFQG
jgi:hypothetical protein